jgi:GNAT superfamily N-acetyltransferase
VSQASLTSAFRIATTADALCISALATQVFLDTYATDGIRPSLAREVNQQLSAPAVLALLAVPGARFVVCERSGHMLGFAQLTLGAQQQPVHARQPAELNRLYVQERFTGAGLGSALLAQAEDLATSEGTKTIWLTAWVGNQRALAFYARRGYADVGATTYTFQDEQYENRVFVKTLPSANR